MTVSFLAGVRPVVRSVGKVDAGLAYDYREVLEHLSGRTDGRVLVELGLKPVVDSFALVGLRVIHFIVFFHARFI